MTGRQGRRLFKGAAAQDHVTAAVNQKSVLNICRLTTAASGFMTLGCVIKGLTVMRLFFFALLYDTEVIAFTQLVSLLNLQTFRPDAMRVGD